MGECSVTIGESSVHYLSAPTRLGELCSSAFNCTIQIHYLMSIPHNLLALDAEINTKMPKKWSICKCERIHLNFTLFTDLLH